MGKKRSPDLRINDFTPEFEAAEEAAKKGDFEKAAESGRSYFMNVAKTLGISSLGLYGLLVMRERISNWEDKVREARLASELKQTRGRIKAREK